MISSLHISHGRDVSKLSSVMLVMLEVLCYQSLFSGYWLVRKDVARAATAMVSTTVHLFSFSQILIRRCHYLAANTRYSPRSLCMGGLGGYVVGLA